MKMGMNYEDKIYILGRMVDGEGGDALCLASR